jgi:antitoxin (DNA-binding transcriptional repressor) of toxin-antitoxin stability system
MDVNEILDDFEQVLDRVERGETIPIERDGKRIARFVPGDSLGPADSPDPAAAVLARGNPTSN